MTGTITALIAMFGAFLMKYGNTIPFFVENPEILEALINGFEWLLSGLLLALIGWLSGKPSWERLYRLIQSVVALMEADRQGRGNEELRAAAIDQILALLPEGRYGIRGWMMRIPGLGRWLIGRLLDQIVSSTRGLMGPKTKNEAKSALKAAREKNKRK